MIHFDHDDEPREDDAPHRRHHHATQSIRGVGVSLESLARAFARTGHSRVADELRGLAGHLDRLAADAVRAFGDHERRRDDRRTNAKARPATPAAVLVGDDC